MHSPVSYDQTAEELEAVLGEVAPETEWVVGRAPTGSYLRVRLVPPNGEMNDFEVDLKHFDTGTFVIRYLTYDGRSGQMLTTEEKLLSAVDDLTVEIF